MDGELRAQGLRKRYGPKEVVRGVDLALRRGEIVALFGPNGAGKTTTFYMVVGFIRPTGGRIYLKGQEITALPMYKRARLGLGYLPQEPSAFRRMTALENLLAVLEFQPLSKKERLEKAKALLEELSIYHLRDRMAYSLSGGRGAGWRSPGPSPPTPTSSFWTSPSPGWIPRTSGRSRR